MFLTAAELRTLTGAVHRSTQIKVLRANRIAYTLNAAGRPVVLAAALEKGGQHATKWTPNKAA